LKARFQKRRNKKPQHAEGVGRDLGKANTKWIIRNNPYEVTENQGFRQLNPFLLQKNCKKIVNLDEIVRTSMKE